jgi:hypothetical protein
VLVESFVSWKSAYAAFSFQNLTLHRRKQTNIYSFDKKVKLQTKSSILYKGFLTFLIRWHPQDTSVHRMNHFLRLLRCYPFCKGRQVIAICKKSVPCLGNTTSKLAVIRNELVSDKLSIFSSKLCREHITFLWQENFCMASCVVRCSLSPLLERSVLSRGTQDLRYGKIKYFQ